MTKMRKRSLKEARREFSRTGLTIASWARTNGYPYKAVCDVLSGRNKGHFGRAHDIAVALGIKEGELREAAV